MPAERLRRFARASPEKPKSGALEDPDEVIVGATAKLLGALEDATGVIPGSKTGKGKDIRTVFWFRYNSKEPCIAARGDCRPSRGGSNADPKQLLNLAKMLM